MKTRLPRSLLAVPLLVMLGGHAFGESIWTATSGNWNEAGKWSPAGVPGDNTNVQISNFGTVTINTADARSDGASIGDDFGSGGIVTVTGSGSLWSTSYLRVGFSGNGTLNVEAGGKVATFSPSSAIGQDGAGQGVATVTGANSLWVNLSELKIGASGSGTLNVAAGGKVTAPSVALADANGLNSKGTLNLTGTAGSRGVLETTLVRKGSGSGGGAINFDGGILRATADNTNCEKLPPGGILIHNGGAYIDTQNYNVGISSSLTDAPGKVGGLTKQGSGKLTLSLMNSYTGTTTVEAGTLFANNSGGSATGTGPVVVSGALNGTLGGTGAVAGPVTVQSGAQLQGGDGTAASGTLSLAGNVNLLDGAKIKLTLGAAGAHSTLARSGTLGTWSFDVDQAFDISGLGLQAGITYQNIITGLSGFETGLASIGPWKIANSLALGYTGIFSFDGANVDLVLTAIPEPGSAGSLLGGAIGLAGLQRLRRRSVR